MGLFKHLSELKANLVETTEQLSQRIEGIMDLSGKNEIRQMEKEILKYLRCLYEYSCHGLMSLIMLQFREFWCTQLYNLSDAQIGLYKLNATSSKKKRKKEFKAKKQSNNEHPVHFVIDIKNKQSLMNEMDALYAQIYVQNRVKQSENARVHKTRSKKEHCNPYIIPPVLIEIERQFSQIAGEYIDDAACTQSDDENVDDMEDEDEDMEEENKENKQRAKQKTKTKQEIKTKKKGRRKRKRSVIESESDDVDEDQIEYADSSDGDEESDSD